MKKLIITAFLSIPLIACNTPTTQLTEENPTTVKLEKPKGPPPEAYSNSQRIIVKFEDGVSIKQGKKALEHVNEYFHFQTHKIREMAGGAWVFLVYFHQKERFAEYQNALKSHKDVKYVNLDSIKKAY